MSELVRIGGSHYDQYRSPAREELLGPIPDLPTFDEDMDAVERKVRSALGKVRLIKSLESPHDAVRRLLKADDERREKQRLSRFPMPWDGPIFETAFEQRRLRILNTLLMAAAKAGARPTIRGKEGRAVTLQIHDQGVGLELDAVVNFTRARHYERIVAPEPKATMRLVIPKRAWTETERWRWDDTDKRKIEDDIEEIAVRLIVAAELQHREHRLSSHKLWLARRDELIEQDRLAKEQAEREERERQVRLAQARVEKLLQDAESLRKAETIREYVERVRALAPQEGHDLTLINSWAAWATQIANTLDPVRTGEFARSSDEEVDPQLHLQAK